MAHVSNVAKYILERLGPVTTLKLQKLVYYVQAWAVAKGAPLISDPVKAWVQGPVVPSLYQQHKGRRQISAADMAGRSEDLTDEDRAHIDGVLAHYGALPPSYLTKLTHFERPWKEARADGERHGHESPAIPLAALRSFYSGRTPEELEAEFQMAVACGVMDEHAQCLARLAL